MQIVAVSKLVVDAEGRAALLATMRRVNTARTWVAAEAMALPEHDRPHARRLQPVFYRALRERFGLGAQTALHALKSVAACFARAPGVVPRFRDTAAIGCPVCGHCDKRNRPSQALFRCVACGHEGHADHVAALNIASRGAANRPIVPDADAGNAGPTPRHPVESRRKPRALSAG